MLPSGPAGHKDNERCYMIESTSKFKVQDIVYNKDGFALARGKWENGDKLRLACRWHEDGGIGYPQTFGKPQWLVFPEDKHLSVEIISTLDPSLAKVVITLT